MIPLERQLIQETLQKIFGKEIKLEEATSLQKMSKDQEVVLKDLLTGSNKAQQDTMNVQQGIQKIQEMLTNIEKMSVEANKTFSQGVQETAPNLLQRYPDLLPPSSLRV